jgi:hypothetical protein
MSSSGFLHPCAVWFKLCVFKVWQREAQDGRQARELIQLLARRMHACSEVKHLSTDGMPSIQHVDILL